MQIKGIQKQKNQAISHRFKVGDSVRIVENGKSNDVRYTIIKLKKSSDEMPLYLLKSDSNPIMLLYYESKNSRLDKLIV